MARTGQTAAAARDPERDRLRLWIKLFDTTHGIEREVRSRLRARFACTLPRFDVMSVLVRMADGITMGDLSRRLRVSNGNVTGVIERLVKDGAVKRWSPPADRRTSLVALTAPGRRAFERMAAVHKQWIDEMLGTLGDNDVAALLRQLDRVNGAADIGTHNLEGDSHEYERI